MESTNQKPETSAGERFPPSEKQDLNQDVQLKIQEAPTERAQKSGGPRTQQGKENSKNNATTHGIFCKVAVTKGESRAEFQNLLNGLRNYFRPEGTLEDTLLEKLAVLFWRERRLIIADGNAHNGNGIDFLQLNELPHWDHLLKRLWTAPLITSWLCLSGFSGCAVVNPSRHEST
jgi:hypothetical protein